MSKRLILFAACLAVSAVWAFPITTQVQFVATLQEIAPQESGLTALTVELTPSISIPVLVSEDTEIRDENDLPASIADLAPGMILKIRGVFAPSGIVALDIEIQENGSEFEVRGVIQQVTPGEEGAGSIRISGFEIQVPAAAQIENRQGDRLTFGDLAPGQLAKVEGASDNGQLVATSISVQRPRERYARIRLEGVISAILSDFEFTVELEGGVFAQVELDEFTEVRGTLAVGAAVRVEGVLTETLAVRARRIVVVDSVRLAPRELKMGPGETRTVSVILLAPRDSDTVFELSSGNPDVAVPNVETLTVPAGELTASFDVTSGDQEGETNIGVSSEGFRGRVKVEVEVEEEGEEEPPPSASLRLMWEPRVIHAVGKGVRELRLRINDRAPEDLIVAISQESGDEEFVAFPETATIPAGAKEVRIEVSFLKDQGDAVLRAVLPDSVGGDDDTLEISLRPVKPEKLSIEWKPDEVELRPGQAGEAVLSLDRPAPYALEAVLSIRNGNRSLVRGLPPRVLFAAGEGRVVVPFTAADHPGKIKLRAALPIQVGGQAADLDIEVKR